MTCSASTPTPCEGRKSARNAVWYNWDTGRWIWVTTDFIIEIRACPFCGGGLPLMGTAQETRAWLRETLADPDE